MVKLVAWVMGALFSFAVFAADGKGGALEKFPSHLLDRTVPISVHVPEAAAVEAWKAGHPGARLRLVLFLPGAWDTPEDLVSQGIYADLAHREATGELPPALWVAVTHFWSWYADRRDGTFPYERFLLEELVPSLERRFPDFGGEASARTVIGHSMGGFGALNLAARSHAFSRCAALSPALVEPPFSKVNWYVRRSIRKSLPGDPVSFAPWNPWKHLGGEAELTLACGTEDKYGLAEAMGEFERVCQERGRPFSAILSPGGHDWEFWGPMYERLAPWIAGGPMPQSRSKAPTP